MRESQYYCTNTDHIIVLVVHSNDDDFDENESLSLYACQAYVDLMFRLGSHVSISEGFGDAVAQEQKMGGTCGQIFVGSPRGWAVSSVTDD